MRNQFLVSILVPIYGVEKYIERCIVNLMEQSYDNLEYIFIDDCGNDQSMDILYETLSRYPNRVSNVHIIKHEKNRGLAAARNTAVAAAKGDFIMHVDSDDWTDKVIVEKCVEHQLKTNADIVFTDILTIYANYSIVEQWPDANSNIDLCLGQLQSKNRWNMWAQMIRRALYINNGIEVKEGCNMGEDFHTAPRLSYYAQCIAYVHEPLYFHDRSNENSYSNNFKESHYIQKIEGCGVLIDFFKNKGEAYIDAINESLLLTSVCALKECSLAGGHNAFYTEQFHKAKELASKYYYSLSLFNRLVLRLAKHRKTLTILCRIFIKLRNTIMIIKQ